MRFVNYNWYIALGFCLIFFISGRQLAESSGGTNAAARRGKRLMGIILLLFALPPFFLFNIAPLITDISLSPWYNSFRAFNRIEIFTSLIAPFTGFATYLPLGAAGHYARFEAPMYSSVMRIIKPLAFPMCALLVSACFAAPVLFPLPGDTAFNDEWSEDGSLYASSPALNGGAAVASVIYNLNRADADGERNIASGTSTDGNGTDFWYIARYAANKGYRCRFYYPSAVDGEIIPSVLRLSANDRTSYISILGRTDEGALRICDPSDGALILTSDGFTARYGIPILALSIEPRD